MQEEKHILIIRLSAMGDVAMSVPVIQQLLQTYPNVRVTVLSNHFFAPLFSTLPRCTFYGVNTKNQHKGIGGLTRLYRTLMAANRFDAVADLHDVLRSKFLIFLFSISRIKTAVIDKGRKEKKELTKKENKILVQLKTTHQRYADVFAALGFPVILDATYPVYTRRPLPGTATALIQPDKYLIGLAAFAKHAEKMYPLHKMEELLALLNQRDDIQVLLFGGGQKEQEQMQAWETSFAVARSVIGKFNLDEELAVISNLNLMVSMDSANMHLAALFQIPVLSIWGATHPFAGFAGWGQTPDSFVQIDLYCRPCSVFGNIPCYRGDHACMHRLAPEVIFQKIEAYINLQ